MTLEQHVLGPDVGQLLWAAMKGEPRIDSGDTDLDSGIRLSQGMKISTHSRRLLQHVRFLDRFISKFDIGDGCWRWLAGHSGDYGIFYDGRAGRRTIEAHRIAYELWRGPIPADQTVDHICFTRDCVRPSHLQLLTRSENCARKRTMLEGRCLKGHPRTPENVYLYPGRRICKICRYNQQLAWKRRNGLAS